MGNHWEKVMDGIKKFVAFPAINFGRTLVVSFQLLPFVLVFKAVGEGRGYKDTCKEEIETFNLYKG